MVTACQMQSFQTRPKEQNRFEQQLLSSTHALAEGLTRFGTPLEQLQINETKRPLSRPFDLCLIPDPQTMAVS